MKKINFAGGEPFIVERGWYVGELIKFSKEDLGIESVTVVSNGSLIKEKWFEDYGKYLDIMAISCDTAEKKLHVASMETEVAELNLELVLKLQAR